MKTILTTPFSRLVWIAGLANLLLLAGGGMLFLAPTRMNAAIPSSSGVPSQAVFVPTAPLTATTFYTITDLGQYFLPAALNDLGQVVGHIQYTDQPVLWLPEPAFGFPAGLNNLPTPAPVARPQDINNAGIIVGWAGESIYDPLASHWRWDEAVQVWQMTNLGTLGGSASQAYGVNDTGQVVGGSLYKEDNFNYLAFLWQNNTMSSLGTLGGGDDSFAYAINDDTTTSTC